MSPRPERGASERALPNLPVSIVTVQVSRASIYGERAPGWLLREVEVDHGAGVGGAAAEFDLFYAGTASRVLRQMVLLTGALTEAEDVTQEAFERAWTHWSAVRDCASPEAWVRTVARRLAVSRWRRVRNASTAWLRHGPPTDPVGPEPGHVALMAALDQLPRAQRLAIVLHHLADLPVEQVAEETGSSVSAVKKQLVRGRAAMALHLSDDELTVREGER